MPLKLVKDKPFRKTAAGKRETRTLAALARLVESEVQLDVILDQDLKVKSDPVLRAAIKKEILRLNPALVEGADVH